ncbi:MAG: hypothetical protein IPI92_20085 [Gemmatimonadetes bacterium]|nr:hypothetical protein [Gemmatimonadota bacterium]MBK8643825.1 hypothetical protein [Candidatus Vicinibacter affinis]
MAITKNAGVHKTACKIVEIGFADLVAGTDTAAIDLPPGAVVLSGSHAYTTEAWNSTSTDTLDVGDAASQNRYLNDGNIRALAANVPLVPTGFSHTGGSLTVKWNSGGGTPTTGALRVVIHYAQLGNATTTYEV